MNNNARPPSLARRIADAPAFQNLVTGCIIVAGVVIGIETSNALVEQWGGLLHLIDKVILWIFVAEAVVKIAAEGKNPWNYFKDPWNVFDFMIVAVCFMPIHTEYVAVLRLARLFRVFKLVRALPKLQILVGALLNSIPSMAYVGLLLGILFYVYAVAGCFIFGPNDPRHFSSLPLAMLTLFRIVTGDAWTDVMYINMYGCDKFGYDGREHMCTMPNASPVGATLYFVSFMLFGAMVILNLFIGVIMNGMEEAREENDAREAQLRGDRPATLAEDIQVLQGELSTLQNRLMILHHRALETDKSKG